MCPVVPLYRRSHWVVHKRWPSTFSSGLQSLDERIAGLIQRDPQVRVQKYIELKGLTSGENLYRFSPEVDKDIAL